MDVNWPNARRLRDAGLVAFRARRRAAVAVRILTAIGMAGFVLAVYVAVVLGLGAGLGRTGSPSVWLSVLATGVVALAFEPVRVRLRGWLARAFDLDPARPEQVLARFPSTVAGLYRAEELPLRMAEVLAEGTGSERAEVWLIVHDEWELGAVWPPAAKNLAVSAGPPDLNEPPENGPGSGGSKRQRRSLPVRHGSAVLGAFSVVPGDGRQLTPLEDRLFIGLAAQSTMALRTVGLREELGHQLRDLRERTADLQATRRDLVRRQDAERQRLERNIHDGAQQEIIALLVSLRLTKTLLPRAPDRAGSILTKQPAAAQDAIETLAGLSRGLYPRVLTDQGAEAALRAVTQLGSIPVQFTATGVRRYTPEIEATLYFGCLEALQNASKHAQATVITMDIREAGGTVQFTVADDGRGFRPDATTGAMAGLTDRVHAVGGSLTTHSEPGSGTTVHGTIPLRALLVEGA